MFKKKWHVSTSFWCQEGEGYLAPQLIIGFGEHLQVGVLRQKLEWLRFVPKSLATGKSSSVSFLDGKMKSFWELFYLKNWSADLPVTAQ